MKYKLLFKRLLASMLLLAVSALSWAYDFQVDGIYYNISGSKAIVTYRNTSYNSYSGEITIPSTVTYNDVEYNVTNIGDCAFAYCYALTSVTIGNGVTSIGEWAFYNSSGLTSVTIGNSVTSIGEHAFRNCSGLTSVTIPNSVTSIGFAAFYGCSGLTSVTIPNCVTSIDEAAFCECSSLTSITLPNSVTNIGDCAFAYCYALTSVTIGNGVTSIGSCAFQYCFGLTSITIPESVKSVGDCVFADCSGLTSVTCLATSVPETGEEVFYNVPQSDATLYVPKSSVNAYKAADQWREFGIILPIGDMPVTVSLNYYDAYGEKKILENRDVWSKILEITPNAIAVVKSAQSEWASLQKNVLVENVNGTSKSYACPEFVLTDLSLGYNSSAAEATKTGFYTPVSFSVKKGIYKRQAYQGYNTVCLPFAFTPSELSSTAKIYVYDHYEIVGNEAVFKRETGTVKAGMPCIVKEPKDVLWNVSLNGKTISSESPSDKNNMAGTYITTDEYQNTGYNPRNNDNVFAPLKQYLHPFRACFFTGDGGAGARENISFVLIDEDGVTAVNEVESSEGNSDNQKSIYTLNGQKIKEITRSGLYIINGKKVYVEAK